MCAASVSSLAPPCDWPAFRVLRVGAARVQMEADGFDLVMSLFVTQNRSGGELRHRFSRFDVFLHSLETYAVLPIRRAYLYVSLAREVPEIELTVLC